jgi:hypothetical protein
MHGCYWHFAVCVSHLRWLHIALLEFLATCFNLIIFHHILPPRGRLLLQADATSTSATSALASETRHSEALAMAYRLAFAEPDFAIVSLRRADVGHIWRRQHRCKRS